MALFEFFILLCIFSLLLGVGVLVLKGFGPHRMARHAGIPHPWMAFLPVANAYLLGLLAERSCYTYKGQTRKLGKCCVVLLLLPLLGFLLYGLSFLGAVNSRMEGLAVIPLFLLVLVPLVAAEILQVYCLYYVFRDYAPKDAVLFTVLHVFTGIGFIFLIVERNTVPVSVTGPGDYPYGRPKYDRWHRWSPPPPPSCAGGYPPQGGGPDASGPRNPGQNG